MLRKWKEIDPTTLSCSHNIFANLILPCHPRIFFSYPNVKTLKADLLS